MRRVRAATLVLVITTATIVTGAAMPSSVSAAPVVPSGFTDAVVASGFNLPTAMSFLPDGRVLVAEKSGLIHVVQTNGTASVVVDLTARVADYWDRGLLGMSPDPDFATNGYVYLLYPFDDGALDQTAPKTLRLTRITMVGNTASQASEVVLIGSLSSPGCAATPGNGACIPNDWYGHAAGDIVFAADKTMYLSIGDNASWDAVTDLALRAQDVNQYPGKILHVDRLGKGLPTNPFWDGNPDSVRSRVFAYGLRNPFRFSLRAGSNNVLTVGDVGWLTHEEINVVTSGKNHGWPCYEGPAQQPGYASKPVCQALYAQGVAAVTAPSITWSTTGGAASVGGPSASSTRFPSPWNRGIFYADYANGWIRYAAADATGALTGAITSFATSVDSPVELEAGPSGDLYYVSIGAGQLRRISLGSTPPPPPAPPGTSLLADLTPVGTPVNGWGPYERNRSNGEQGAADGTTLTINGTTYASGLGVHAASAIQFAVSGCTSFSAQVGVDDEVGSLGSVVFQVWNGTTTKLYDSGTKTGLDAASSVNVSIAGVTDLRLVVTDAGNGAAYDHADWANASITCGAVGAPTASILTPTAGTRFTVGSTVSFTGQATDLKDGFVASTGLSWTVTVHHCPAGNCHNHFLTSLTGSSGSFVVPDHGDDTYLTLDFVAVDGDGLTSSASRRIDFATSTLTVTSSPAGRTLLYNGNPVATPYVANVPVGSVRSIGAPTPQDGYTFNSWSDGGAATHSITVGASNATYTASYTAPPTPPPPPPPATSTVYVSTLTPSAAAVNGWGPIERDRSNGESAGGDGLTLRVGGVAFTRGLGVHAASDVRYAVPAGCTTFTTQVGVDDEVGNLGSAVFQVWNGTTTKLYDSGIRTGVDAAIPATVALTGVSTLRLVVTDAGNGNAYDHADWLDARFTCSTV